ncbi:MAG: trehalose-phosphatase [Candidatus Margulisiibacteriota bacterium]
MIYLFSKIGRQFLESLSYTQTLYAFDFDGTLSKIVLDPPKAAITLPRQVLLRQLGEVADVAIISGRGLDDLRSKFSGEPHFFVGNHGLEGVGEQHEISQEAVAWKQQLETAFRIQLPKGYGIEIEDKGVSLAVHYRKSRHKKQVKAAILALVETLNPTPRVVLGKCVINLVPESGFNKGTAFLSLMRDSGAKAGFYIGDDDTDEDVFGLSQDLCLLTVRVGQKKQSKARFYIKNQGEITRLLTVLASFYTPSQSPVKGDDT